jgi:ribonuclease P protein component
LRRPAQFRSVISSGLRARRGSLVVHYRPGPSADVTRPTGDSSSGSDTGSAAPIVGFVVGRTVGPSVVRHQVSRRLRAQMSARLDQLGPSSATVVRALPGAGALDSAEIGRELDRALTRLSVAPSTKTDRS